MTDHEALFEANRDWAVRVARKAAANLPACFDPDDLAQEALVETWKQAQKFDASKGVPFQGFAYLAVRGAVLMKVRRRNWKDSTHDDLRAEERYPTLTDPQPLPDAIQDCEAEAASEVCIHEWRRAWLCAAVQRLDKDKRVLITRAYIDGIDLDELAAEQGISRRELSDRLRVAVRVLRSKRPVEPAHTPPAAPRLSCEPQVARPLRPPLRVPGRDRMGAV